MNEKKRPIRSRWIGCLWICLITVLLSGCSIRIGVLPTSSEDTEVSGLESSEESAAAESEENESSSREPSGTENTSQSFSQESSYSSILDYIPEHKKHFLQKKDRVTEKEESQEESSEENSGTSEENSEESSPGQFNDNDKTKYLIRINKTTNVATVYGKDSAGRHSVPIRSMICSTGTTTPIGTFMMGYQSRWKGLSGGQWAQYVSHIAGDFLIQSAPYKKKSPDSLVTASYNLLGTTGSNGSVYVTVADAYWIYMNCDAYNTLIQIGFFGTTDPWGKPSVIRIPTAQTITWDPSDPGEDNPWNTRMPYFTGIRNYTIYVGDSTPDLLKNVRGYDTCGNEQTGLIRVSGSVNGYVPGTYTVTYYLTDVLGRTGIQKASVTVQARPESSRPESSRPESSRPESSHPESSRPESSRPESSRPESSRPESSQPESSQPESSSPESSAPESSPEESSHPEQSAAESSSEESSQPESPAQESSEPPIPQPESSQEESMEQEITPPEPPVPPEGPETEGEPSPSSLLDEAENGE